MSRDRAGNYGPDAVCLAVAQLAQDFPNSGGPYVLNTSERILWSNEANPGGLNQAVIQFSASSATATNLNLRVVASSSSAAPGNFSDPPADDSASKHVRGLWPYSTLNLDCGTFDARPVEGSPPIKRVAVCERNGPEHQDQSYDKQPFSDDPYGTANIGAYGANLLYHFVLLNSGSQPSPVYAYASARRDATDGTNPAHYRGAVWITSPGSFLRRKINSIVAPTPPADLSPSYVRLTSSADGAESPIMLSPGEQRNLTIAVANAGTATLPFNLILSGISFNGVETPL